MNTIAEHELRCEIVKAVGQLQDLSPKARNLLVTTLQEVRAGWRVTRKPLARYAADALGEGGQVTSEVMAGLLIALIAPSLEVRDAAWNALSKLKAEAKGAVAYAVQS